MRMVNQKIMKAAPKKLLLPILFLGLFLPIFNAQALSLGGFFGIGDFAYEAVANIFGYSAYLLFASLGTFMGVAVTALAWVVNLRIYTNVPVIEESWKIMRDFANMLFIIALIVMAYGTIFNIKGYDFRSLIPKFLIAALLINFSLVIGGLIIDAAQILNNTFLNAMGDIAGHLGQGLEPWKLLPEAANASDGAEAISSLAFSSFVTLLFAIFMAFVFLISVAVPLTVALVRIPILWALLIVSPMAWLLSILPATKGAYDKWWHQFIGWNLFLPYYLFFMYFALYFLDRKDEVLAGLGQTFVNDKITGLEGLQSDFTFGLIFYYFLVAIFMIGGTKVAMSAGTFSGTGVVQVAKWGRDRVANRIGWTAAGRAVKGRFDELGEKEEARIARQTGYMRDALGRITGGKVGFLEEQQAKDIGEIKKRFERITDPAELRKLMDKGPLRNQLAAREVMKDRGLLTSDDYRKTFELYGGNNTLAGRQFAKSIDYGKLSSTDRGDWYKDLTDVEAKRKVAEVMAEKGEFDTVDSIQRAQSLYALPGEKANFLKKAARRITDNTTLRGLMTTGSDQEKLAVREILAERGALTGAEMFDTYSMYRAGSKEAVDFGTKVDFENLSQTDRQTWYNNAPDNEVKRKSAEVMAEKGDPSMMTAPALAAAANLYANDAEKIKFLEKAEKKNFMATVDAKAALGVVRDAAGTPLATRGAVLNFRVTRMKADALAEIGYDGGWGNPDFVNAVQAKINALQTSEPSIPGGPPTTPGGPPIMPKPGGGERFKKGLQDNATDTRSLAQIFALTIP